MNNMDDLIKRMKDSSDKLTELENEILNNPNFTQETKDFIMESRKKLEKDKEEYERKLKENSHKKIIGYNPKTFEPIYE